MTALRREQGLADQNTTYLPSNNNEHQHDVFDISPNDSTEDGGVISSFKLMISVLNSDFKIAQQMDDYLSGNVRKGTYKFLRSCALLSLLEIIGDIASNLLKYIVFDEGNFSRPRSTSNKFISPQFIYAAQQYVSNYIRKLPIIDGRPIIYIDKLQVERSCIYYSYVETTTKILFDASLVNKAIQIDQEANLTSHLSKQYVICFCFFILSKISCREKQELSWMMKVLKTPVIFFSNNYVCKSIPGCAGSGVLKNASTDVRNGILNSMVKYGLLITDRFLSGTILNSYAKVPPSILQQNKDSLKLFSMFGASLTFNDYEKLFENFGLVTASDASIVPITPIGIKLLRENNAFVNFYHCLDKEQSVLKMIQERVALKEINLVRYHKNDPYRYELINESRKHINFLSNNSSDSNNNQNINYDALSTAVVYTTNHLQEQFLPAGKNNLTILIEY
jgi:hypothetical protein